MKFILFIFFFYFTSFLNAQQDLKLLFQDTWDYPQTGCDVGGPQDYVKLTVKNNSGTGTVFGNQIYIGYRIDGGAIVRDSFPSLGGGATWSFYFVNNPEDFSACGDTFNIETWVEYAFDPDNSNDTIAYQFINFCSPTPGTLLQDSTYQNTNDLDTLLLLNSENATSYYWQYSLDSSFWQNINVNDTLLPIAYIDTLRYYRVVGSNSECPSAYSNSVEIRYLDPTLFTAELNDQDFVLFPNPTSDIVYFSTKEKMTITVCDVNGRILYSKTLLKGFHKISILEWEKGLYIFKFWNKNGYKARRVIKK